MKKELNMKKSILFASALLLPIINLSVRAGDQREVGPFHSIIVSSEIVAELVLTKQEAIKPEFERASEDDMIIEVVDSILKIRMKTGKYKDSKLKVRIEYSRNLRMLEASGRAQIWSDEDLYLNNLTVKLFNGGEMRFNLYCDSLDATLTQGSIIFLRGKSRALKAKVNTGGSFSGYEFETEQADVSASGGGKAKISVSRSLKASASSKGFIGYVGDPPELDQKTTLAGEILKTFLEE